MIKKNFNHFWMNRKQFLKYFITGFSAFILDIGSLFILVDKLGLNKVLSTVISQVFLLNYVFFINKWWSFKSSGTMHRKIVRFYILAASNAAF
jgi:putative flippase GtrA